VVARNVPDAEGCMTVGYEIRRLREEKGWSQAKLAAAADMGVSGVSQIETGARNPSAITLAKLANALGAEVADLFPKGQPPLPFESEERRQASMENLAALIDSMDDEQLVRFREFLKEQRIGLSLAHHDHPKDRTLRRQYLEAVEKVMCATLEVVERGYGRVEEPGREEPIRSAKA
jgi:transcriptional regulator with XRE-family HTH domain